MKQFFNKTLLGLAGFGLAATTIVSCADNDVELYDIESPEWLQEKIDSIAAEKNSNISTDEGVDTRTPFATFTITGYTNSSSVHLTGQCGKFLVTTPDKSMEDKEFDGGENWWDDESPTTGDFTLADGATLTFTVKQMEANGSIWIFEIYNPGGADGKKSYVTMTSLCDYWTAENTDDSEVKASLSDETLKNAFKDYKDEEVVTIRATRNGSDIVVSFISDVYRGDPAPTSISVANTPKAIEIGSNDFWKETVATIGWDNNTETVMEKDNLIISTTAPLDEEGNLSTLGTYTVTVTYNKTQKKGELTTPVSTSYIIDVTASISSIEIVGTGATYYYTPGTTEIKAEDVNISSFVKSVLGKTGSSDIEIPATEYTATVKSTSLTEIVIEVSYKEFTQELSVTVEPSAKFNINICGTEMELFSTNIIGDGTFVDDEKFGLTFQNPITGDINKHYLEIPSSAVNTCAEAKNISLSFWVKNYSSAGINQWSPMFTINNGVDWTFGQLRCGGQLIVNQDGYIDGGQHSGFEGATWISGNDDWHYVVASFYETGLILYIDGELVAENVADGTEGKNITNFINDLGNEAKTIKLGGGQLQNWADADQPLQFAKISITNSTPTADEVKAAYNADK